MKNSDDTSKKDLTFRHPEGASLTDLQIKAFLKRVPVNSEKITYQCTTCGHEEVCEAGFLHPSMKTCQKCQQFSFKNLGYIEMKPLVLNYGYILSEIPCPVCQRETNDPRVRAHDWEYTCPQCKNYVRFVDLNGYARTFGAYGPFQDDFLKFELMHYQYKYRLRFPLRESPTDKPEGEDPEGSAEQSSD